MFYRGARSDHQSGPVCSIEVGQFRVAKSDAARPLRSAGPSPEHAAIRAQARSISREALNALCVRDREVLRRFYLLEQTQEQIH